MHITLRGRRMPRCSQVGLAQVLAFCRMLVVRRTRGFDQGQDVGLGFAREVIREVTRQALRSFGRASICGKQ